MTDPIIVPAEEVKITEPEVEQKIDNTIGSILETKTDKTVPEAVFLESKKARKELEKRVKELEASAERGATSDEISDDVDAIGEEFGVDKNFLKKLTAAIEKKTEARLQPMVDKERNQARGQLFDKGFAETMETLPEYAHIVNKEVIKVLSALKGNQDKTFAKLIEETYGNALQGKRTVETTTPRGGKTLDEIDFSRAKRDSAYFAEVMADPVAKAKYNATLVKSMNL